MSGQDVQDPAAGAEASSPPTAAEPRAPARPESPLSVLRERNFALYWSGQLVSLVGTWMQQLALSWVVLRLASTGFALGLVNFVAAIPPAALMLSGGVAADRHDKRRILIATQVVFLLQAAALAALVRADALELWHVLVFALLVGIGIAYDLPASQALVPDLVRRDQIASAVQLMQAIFHGSRLIGPALAGWLIGRYGEFSAFVGNALSFLPVIATLLVIHPHPSHAARPRPGAVELREGLAYVRERRHLMALMGLAAVVTVLVFPNMVVLMPFYVKNVLHLEAHDMGLMMSAGGAGALVGSMSLLVVAPARRLARIAAGVAGMSTGLLVLFLAPTLVRSSVVSARGAFLVAAGGAMVLTFSVASAMGLVATILQQEAPDHLRGRVMSLHGLVFMGLMPFASLGVTRFADAVSMRVELLVASLGVALAGTWLLRVLAAERGGAAQSAGRLPVP